MSNNQFISKFHNRNDARYGWFKNPRHNYDPFIFSLLDEHDKSIIEEWYMDTETKWPNGIGASGFTAISTIAGFILGSGIQNLVQLGHYAGFSTLMLGYVFKYMGIKNALISFDIHEKATDYTIHWIKKAGLEEQVKIMLLDSTSGEAINEAKNYLVDIESVFIDSSHNYSHTKEELHLWHEQLIPFGFLFLLGVSTYAKAYDSEKQGGVKAAMLEFMNDNNSNSLLINSKIGENKNLKSIYTDPRGLGIMQKC